MTPKRMGESGGKTPAEAGNELEDPETMTDTQDAARPVAQAINGFAEMAMERTGGCNYSVYSWRNGENTIHRVNTAQMACTCEDMQWNRDGGHDVCDHVAYAVYHAPKDRDIGEEAFGNIVGMLTEMNDYKNALEQRRNQIDTASEAEPSETIETGQTDTDADESVTTPYDAEEKAEQLQEAYDDVVEDMQVKVGAGGAIWVQTGRDTPDTLPGPGNVEVFDALLKDPDQVEYVHDDHAAAVDRPGEWWKNRLEPQDIDEYVEEVL